MRIRMATLTVAWQATLALVVVLAAAGSCVWAAPEVQQDDAAIVVSNAHFSITVGKNSGGTVSAWRRADGRQITSGHGLYTDRGIYGDGVYVGTTKEKATVTVQRDETGSVTVRAEGVLRDADGALPGEPGKIAYWVQYIVSDAPALKVEWGATPDFSTDSGEFFSYIFSITDTIGLFANTDEGVLLQDPADHSTRTFQSASEPLNRDDPWWGFMFRDGTVLSLTGLRSEPAFANLFCHENGTGGGGVFLAWINGRRRAPLEKGVAWRAAVTLGLHDSFEQFRRSRK